MKLDPLYLSNLKLVQLLRAIRRDINPVDRVYDAEKILYFIKSMREMEDLKTTELKTNFQDTEKELIVLLSQKVLALDEADGIKLCDLIIDAWKSKEKELVFKSLKGKIFRDKYKKQIEELKSGYSKEKLINIFENAAKLSQDGFVDDAKSVHDFLEETAKQILNACSQEQGIEICDLFVHYSPLSESKNYFFCKKGDLLKSQISAEIAKLDAIDDNTLFAYSRRINELRSEGYNKEADYLLNVLKQKERDLLEEEIDKNLESMKIFDENQLRNIIRKLKSAHDAGFKDVWENGHDKLIRHFERILSSCKTQEKKDIVEIAIGIWSEKKSYLEELLKRLEQDLRAEKKRRKRLAYIAIIATIILIASAIYLWYSGKASNDNRILNDMAKIKVSIKQESRVSEVEKSLQESLQLLHEVSFIKKTDAALIMEEIISCTILRAESESHNKNYRDSKALCSLAESAALRAGLAEKAKEAKEKSRQIAELETFDTLLSLLKEAKDSESFVGILGSVVSSYHDARSNINESYLETTRKNLWDICSRFVKDILDNDKKDEEMKFKGIKDCAIIFDLLSKVDNKQQNSDLIAGSLIKIQNSVIETISKEEFEISTNRRYLEDTMQFLRDITKVGTTKELAGRIGTEICKAIVIRPNDKLADFTAGLEVVARWFEEQEQSKRNDFVNETKLEQKCEDIIADVYNKSKNPSGIQLSTICQLYGKISGVELDSGPYILITEAKQKLTQLLNVRQAEPEKIAELILTIIESSLKGNKAVHRNKPIKFGGSELPSDFFSKALEDAHKKTEDLIDIHLSNYNVDSIQFASAVWRKISTRWAEIEEAIKCKHDFPGSTEKRCIEIIDKVIESIDKVLLREECDSKLQLCCFAAEMIREGSPEDKKGYKDFFGNFACVSKFKKEVVGDLLSDGVPETRDGAILLANRLNKFLKNRDDAIEKCRLLAKSEIARKIDLGKLEMNEAFLSAMSEASINTFKSRVNEWIKSGTSVLPLAIQLCKSIDERPANYIRNGLLDAIKAEIIAYCNPNCKDASKEGLAFALESARELGKIRSDDCKELEEKVKICSKLREIIQKMQLLAERMQFNKQDVEKTFRECTDYLNNGIVVIKTSKYPLHDLGWSETVFKSEFDRLFKKLLVHIRPPLPWPFNRFHVYLVTSNVQWNLKYLDYCEDLFSGAPPSEVVSLAMSQIKDLIIKQFGRNVARARQNRSDQELQNAIKDYNQLRTHNSFRELLDKLEEAFVDNLFKQEKSIKEISIDYAISLFNSVLNLGTRSKHYSECLKVVEDFRKYALNDLDTFQKTDEKMQCVRTCKTPKEFFDGHGEKLFILLSSAKKIYTPDLLPEFPVAWLICYEVKELEKLTNGRQPSFGSLARVFGAKKDISPELRAWAVFIRDHFAENNLQGDDDLESIRNLCKVNVEVYLDGKLINGKLELPIGDNVPIKLHTGKHNIKFENQCIKLDTKKITLKSPSLSDIRFEKSIQSDHVNKELPEIKFTIEAEKGMPKVIYCICKEDIVKVRKVRILLQEPGGQSASQWDEECVRTTLHPVVIGDWLLVAGFDEHSTTIFVGYDKNTGKEIRRWKLADLRLPDSKGGIITSGFITWMGSINGHLIVEYGKTFYSVAFINGTWNEPYRIGKVDPATLKFLNGINPNVINVNGNNIVFDDSMGNHISLMDDVVKAKYWGTVKLYKNENGIYLEELNNSNRLSRNAHIWIFQNGQKLLGIMVERHLVPKKLKYDLRFYEGNTWTIKIE